MSTHIFSTAELESMLKRLKAVYSAEFRHSYADFFNLIVEVWDEDNPDVLDSLSNNLETLRQLLEKNMVNEEGYDFKFYASLMKLSDHINLEIGRFNYYRLKDEKTRIIEDKVDAIEKRAQEAEELVLTTSLTISASQQSINKSLKNAEKKMSEVQTQVESAEKAAQQAVTDSRETTKKLSDSQKEYISILGIFASIILVLMTGVTFSAAVLESVSKTNIIVVIIAALTIGLVLFNIVYILFDYIDRLVHGSTSKRIELWWVPNIVMGGLLALAIFAWILGASEYREKRINEIYGSNSDSSSESQQIQTE